MHYLVYCCLHGTAPPYLTKSLHMTTKVTARCRLRSANTLLLLVQSTRRVTLGDRAFFCCCNKVVERPAYFCLNCCIFADFFGGNARHYYFNCHLGFLPSYCLPIRELFLDSSCRRCSSAAPFYNVKWPCNICFLIASL